MATIGEIAVNIIAKTSRFNRAMKNARRTTKQFATDTRSSMRMASASISTMSKLAVGLMGSGVVVSMGRAAQSIDDLAKTSDKLGIATERLAGLHHAAEITGVQTNTLNMALQRMTRRVAEANQGTGEARGALKELGLEASSLMRLSLDKQFSRIADRMQLVKTQADRVRLAMKLFDSEGVALVNTLALGGRGLEEMQGEAARLGKTVSRFDAAKVEAMNDAFAKMRTALEGVTQELTLRTAPAIEKVLDRWTEWVRRPGTIGRGQALRTALDIRDENAASRPPTFRENVERRMNAGESETLARLKAFLEKPGGTPEEDAMLRKRIAREQERLANETRKGEKAGADALKSTLTGLGKAVSGLQKRFVDLKPRDAIQKYEEGYNQYTGERIASTFKALTESTKEKVAGLLSGLAENQLLRNNRTRVEQERLAHQRERNEHAQFVAGQQTVTATERFQQAPMRALEANTAEGFAALRANKRIGEREIEIQKKQLKEAMQIKDAAAAIAQAVVGGPALSLPPAG